MLGRRERRRVELLVFQHVAKTPLGTRKIQFVALFGLRYGIAISKIEIQVCSNPHIFFFRFLNAFFSVLIKAQGTSNHAGYFFAGYGCFPDPYVTGMVYKDPDIRKFDLKVLNFLSCFL